MTILNNIDGICLKCGKSDKYDNVSFNRQTNFVLQGLFGDVHCLKCHGKVVKGKIILEHILN